MAAEALGKIGPAAHKAVPHLIRMFYERYFAKKNAPDVAMEALVRIGEPAVQGLVEAIRTKPQVRILAPMTLEKIGPAAKEAIPELQKLIHDNNPAVRAAASEALLKIQGKR